jgi:hypothetical protein
MVDFPKLCLPSMIFLVLSVISTSPLLFTNMGGITALLIKIVCIILWTWFLNFLCQKGLETISWILVILPYLVMFGVFTVFMDMINKIGKNVPVIMVQGQQESMQHQMP